MPNWKNQVKPGWTGFCPKKQTETGQFEPVSVRFRFKKNQFDYFYFIKTKPNWKWLFYDKHYSWIINTIPE